MHDIIKKFLNLLKGDLEWFYLLKYLFDVLVNILYYDLVPVLDRERFIAYTLYKKLWIHDYSPCPYTLDVAFLFLSFCLYRLVCEASFESVGKHFL